VREAIKRARENLSHMTKIQVEVDTLEQLTEVLASGRVDAVLLDNMDVDTLRKAVTQVNGKAITEASGNITAKTIAQIASSGVDLISVGWITHSAPILDIALDF
jgi:nicotinate-nucleotide pyrophosphorylase (carboxylating)